MFMRMVVGHEGTNSNLDPFDGIHHQQAKMPIECIRVPNKIE